MNCSIIDIARTIDQDRNREVATCRRINQALKVRQVQPTHRVQVVVGWLWGVTDSLHLNRQETLQGRQTTTS